MRGRRGRIGCQSSTLSRKYPTPTPSPPEEALKMALSRALSALKPGGTEVQDFKNVFPHQSSLRNLDRFELPTVLERCNKNQSVRDQSVSSCSPKNCTVVVVVRFWTPPAASSTISCKVGIMNFRCFLRCEKSICGRSKRLLRRSPDPSS